MLKRNKPQKTTANGLTNGAFTSDIEMNQNNLSDEVVTSSETIQLENNSSKQFQSTTILNGSPKNIFSEEADTKEFETESDEFELEEVNTSSVEQYDVLKSTDVKPTQKVSPPQVDHLKLNEISSVDDIKHICVERREPNGTTYFVEIDLVQNSIEENDINIEDFPMENGINTDEYIEEVEKNMVERVLSQTDIELRPKSEPILSTPPEFEVSESEEEVEEQEEEKEVRAIVHASNEHSSPFELSESTSIESSIPFEHSLSFECLTPNKIATSPGVIRPVCASEKHSYQRHSLNFQIGIYEALPKQKLLYKNDKERLAFKMRLENLFGQNDETATINRAKSNFSSPIIPHSLRLSTLNHSISAPESLLDEVISKDTNKDVPSKIPIPPAFSQELFDTVGRRSRKEFSSTSDVIDVDGTINDHVTHENINNKGNLSRTKAHENLAELDVENDAPTDIKQKLEQIFSKGRITQLDSRLDFDTNRNSNNENIRRSKRHEPFDTVRKQKMLFSDVLKSIGPDIHSNLHPIHTTAAIDIQETQRRESLD